MKSVLDDKVTVWDYILAVALVYVGCELYTIRPEGRNVEFVVLCPEEDFKAYRDEYNAGTMQISDVKAFGRTYSLVSRLVKDARRDGIYTNPDFDCLV